MQPTGRRIALSAGLVAIVVLALGAVIIWRPVSHELAFRALLSDDPAWRKTAVKWLGRTGWEDCLTRVVHMAPGTSYQIFLRRASLTVPPLIVGREWEEIKALLQQNGFEAIEAWENGDPVNVHYRLKKGILTLPGGFPLDLILLLQARNLNKPNGQVAPGRVSRADVALLADLRMPYAEVAEKKPFPSGTVLAEVLGLAQVKATGAEWPILKEIVVNYGFLFDRWMKYSPSGFQVSVKYVASLSEDVGRKSWTFYFNSGLDPLQTVDGLNEPGSGFRSEDKLSPGERGGGNESWNGEETTAEANKKKYLRRAQEF
jgi:hypothetical protein